MIPVINTKRWTIRVGKFISGSASCFRDTSLENGTASGQKVKLVNEHGNFFVFRFQCDLSLLSSDELPFRTRYRRCQFLYRSSKGLCLLRDDNKRFCRREGWKERETAESFSKGTTSLSLIVSAKCAFFFFFRKKEHSCAIGFLSCPRSDPRRFNPFIPNEIFRQI